MSLFIKVYCIVMKSFRAPSILLTCHYVVVTQGVAAGKSSLFDKYRGWIRAVCPVLLCIGYIVHLSY